MEKLLFFHGGPGLNSNPERHLLTEAFAQIGLDFFGWDEPSPQRGTAQLGKDLRFQECLESAEKYLLTHFSGGNKVHLLSSSMGCWFIGYLLQKYPDYIGQVFISGPCFLLPTTAVRAFKIVAADYLKHGEIEKAMITEKIEQQLSGKFDENELNGWEMALQNPRFLQLYWYEKSWLESYFSYFAEPAYAFDFDNFAAIRKGFVAPYLEKIQNKCTIIYGAADVVMAEEEELHFIRSHFANLSIHQLEQAGHYPHIEQSKRVLEIIQTSLQNQL